MAKPVNWEGVALASSAVLNNLINVMLLRGVLSRDDVALIMDQALLSMEEVSAVSENAAAAHTHLTLMQRRLLDPDGPAGPPASPARDAPFGR